MPLTAYISQIKRSQNRAKLTALLTLTLTFTAMVLAALPSSTLASDMILKNLNGEFQSIGQYTGKGKWTVVMLWASDCHVCNQEVKNYTAFHVTHKDKDAIVLGVSLDGASKQKEAEDFVKRHDVNFENLIGEPMLVAGIYQEVTGDSFRGTPTFLVYGPDGKIRGAQAGAVPTDIIESFIAREATNSKK